MKKSVFFDFLHRREQQDFDSFLEASREDEDYIDWNDFLLPQQYGLDSQLGAEAEYQAIRSSCALFDVSPICKIRLTGPQSGRLLDYLLTRPVSTAPAMRGIYVAFCHGDGNLKDDAILYKFAEDDYLLMPSDIDHSDYLQSLRRQLGIAAADVHIHNCTHDWCGLAIQGPESAAVLSSMGFVDIEQLAPFAVADYEFARGTIKIARMGFTADLGYECWLSPDQAEAFTQSIQQAREHLGIAIPGYGLRALEACRLEGGFVVAGWDFATELDPDPNFNRTPYEVGLGWLVKLDGDDFVGRAALRQQQKSGQRFVLRSMSTPSRVKPEDGAPVFAAVAGETEQQVGSINCSVWSWGLQQTIGNISLQTEFADLNKVWFKQGGQAIELALTQGPALQLARRNRVPAALHRDIDLD